MIFPFDRDVGQLQRVVAWWLCMTPSPTPSHTRLARLPAVQWGGDGT